MPDRAVTILRVTEPTVRYRLRVSRHGLIVLRERPMVGGGWYIKDALPMPWPWAKNRP